jgi:hypothetical protein
MITAIHAMMAIRVAVKYTYMDCFECLGGKFPEQRPEEYTPQLAPKTEVIPLHFLPLNEMAKILTADVTMMEAVYQNAGVGKDDLPNILVGGISRHKTYQLM